MGARDILEIVPNYTNEIPDHIRSSPLYYEQELDFHEPKKWTARHRFHETGGEVNPRDVDHTMIVPGLKAKYHLMSDGYGKCYVYDYPRGNKIWKSIGEKGLDALTINVTPEGVKKSVRTEAWQQVTSEFCEFDIKWNQIKDYEVPLAEGILDFRTGAIRDHSPSDYIDRVIPHKYNKNAECPVWQKCLNDWFGNDSSKKDFLQEFFGYILTTSHAKYKMALILFGLSDTGKSQVQEVAEILVGKENKSSIDIADFGDPKKVAPIEGKFLNVSSDIDEETIMNAGGFKRLVSTGDSIQIDQKYERIRSITPTAKFIIATNHLPKIRDGSGAAFNRMTILEFTNVIPKNKQDRQLMNKLSNENEIQGILSWAIAGAVRLWKNKGKWTKVESSENLKREYQILSNPILGFIHTSGKVCINEQYKYPVKDFRLDFIKWNGRTWTANAITRKMKELGYNKCKLQGGRAEGWVGLGVDNNNEENNIEFGNKELPDW